MLLPLLEETSSTVVARHWAGEDEVPWVAGVCAAHTDQCSPCIAFCWP